MQANTKPTTASGDGAPGSEDPAQVKINSQLVDCATPVRVHSTMTTAAPFRPVRQPSPYLRVASGLAVGACRSRRRLLFGGGAQINPPQALGGGGGV